MIPYFLRRTLSALPLLLGITLISFAMVQLAPGGPFASSGSARTSPETVEQLRKLYGLDLPVHVQYGRWLGKLARGDLGTSLDDGEPVLRKLAARFPATLQLALFATVLSVLLGVPLGMAAAQRPGDRFDRWSQDALLTAMALPGFWLGYLLLFGCIHLFGAPVLGATSYIQPPESWWLGAVDRLRHLVLPGTVLALPMLVLVARHTRASAIEQAAMPFLTTARAKGLSETQVTLRYWLPVSVLPVVAVLSVGLPELLAGSVLIETVFAWPGMGRLGYEAVLGRDYPVIMGLTVFAAGLVVVAGIAGDLCYAWLDPRIRLGATAGGERT